MVQKLIKGIMVIGLLFSCTAGYVYGADVPSNAELLKELKEMREMIKRQEARIAELESRLDIYLEQYCKSINVETMLTIEISRTLIFPAAIRYQNELASTCANLKAVGYEFDTDTLDKMTTLVKSLQDSTNTLAAVAAKVDALECLHDKSKGYCFEVMPAMNEVRKYADELEGIVADDLWPLPTYQEMLFIR